MISQFSFLSICKIYVQSSATSGIELLSQTKLSYPQSLIILIIILCISILILHLTIWFIKRYYIPNKKEEIIGEVTLKVQGQMGDKIREIEMSVRRYSEETKGLYWHIAANYAYINKFYDHAFKSGLWSLQSFLQIKDYEKFRGLLRNYTKNFINKINRGTLNEIFKDMESSDDEFINKLKEMDQDHVVTKDIEEFRKALKNLK